MLGRVTERERETNGKGERVVRQGENTLGVFVLSSPCSACEVCGESLDDDALLTHFYRDADRQSATKSLLKPITAS